MAEFVLIETRARGARWCVVRGRSKQYLESLAERRQRQFPKCREEVLPRETWETEKQQPGQQAA